MTDLASVLPHVGSEDQPVPEELADGLRTMLQAATKELEVVAVDETGALHRWSVTLGGIAATLSSPGSDAGQLLTTASLIPLALVRLLPIVGFDVAGSAVAPRTTSSGWLTGVTPDPPAGFATQRLSIRDASSKHWVVVAVGEPWGYWTGIAEEGAKATLVRCSGALVWELVTSLFVLEGREPE